jgi:hemoglobin-like flavoprotein
MVNETNLEQQTLKLIEMSLMQVSEISEDITKDIYLDYFARCSGSESLMLYIEDRERGRMMAEVFRLLLEEDLQEQFGYLCFETKTHLAYGVESDMYDNLFAAVQNTVKNTLGSLWGPEFDHAWKQRISELGRAIKTASAVNA